MNAQRLVGWALLLLVACDDSSRPAPEVELQVDPALKPAAATLEGADGSQRPVAALVDAAGVRTDFVLGELVVATDDRAKLDAFLARWGGQVVSENDFAAAGLQGVPSLYHVRLDASKADTAELLERVRRKNGEAKGAFRTSSEEASRLLAVALAEAAETGMTVSPNWVLAGDGLAEGRTNEAFTGNAGYVNDAFSWPYMTRGSAQDIGVTAAWQALLSADRLDNKVRILVIDGGFSPNDDFPEVRAIFGAPWDRPNPSHCSSGNACPWHGTEVVTALMGRPDNAFGAAGPAGPVGELVAMQAPGSVGEWVTAVMGGWTGTAFGVAGTHPRIINISAGFELGLGWEALSALLGPPLGVVLSSMTATIRSSGTLIFASAGNAGKDVDNYGESPEGSLFIPCELSGVICVGGMDHDQARLAEGTEGGERVFYSNYGSRADADSVDIDGPYYVYAGSTPNTEDLGNVARLRAGTSFSSPFVAGVAALVWAADPGLSANRVWEILHDTAHVGGVHDRGGSQRRVNAAQAVRVALGGDAPPFVRIDSPTDGATLHWRLPATLQALVYDTDDDAPAVTWRSSRDGALGSGATLTTRALSVGSHTLRASVSSGGATRFTEVDVTVQNSAPGVAIAAPVEGATFCPNETIPFQATVSDLNNPTDFPFPASGIVWSSSPGGVSGTGAAIVDSVATVGSYTVTVTATDEHGASATASRGFSVVSCTNNPPSVAITSPADVAGSGPDLVVDVTDSDADGWYATVTLQGSATDTEDGALSGTALVWRTDKGEVQPGGPATGAQELGTGGTRSVRLYSSCTGAYFGTVDHTLSLTATDSGGQSRSVTRVIRVRTLC